MNNSIEYYYAVRDCSEETEILFKAGNLVNARQKAMKEYKNKLLSKVKGSSIDRNTAFPVSIFLVEENNGECNYYPVTGKQPHEMERG